MGVPPGSSPKVKKGTADNGFTCSGESFGMFSVWWRSLSSPTNVGENLISIVDDGGIPKGE